MLFSLLLTKVFFIGKWAPSLWKPSLETAFFGSQLFHPPVWPCIHDASACTTVAHVKTQSLWSAWCLNLPLPHSLWVFPMAPQSLTVVFFFKFKPLTKGLHGSLGSLGDWIRHDGSRRKPLTILPQLWPQVENHLVCNISDYIFNF